MKKPLIALVVLAAAALGLTACEDDDSEVVNHNLSKAAQNFELMRRVVVVNGVTNDYVLSVEGRCDIDPAKTRVWITCKVEDGNGPDAYKRHQVYKSDNVFVFVEQLEDAKVSAYHYRMTFKPQTILPDVDFRGSTSEGPQKQD